MPLPLIRQRQAQHGGASQRHYAEQSRITSGARSWVFGELPERIDAAAGTRRQVGYPALVDEGETVGLRVFATPPEARASHVRGTARLVRLVAAVPSGGRRCYGSTSEMAPLP